MKTTTLAVIIASGTMSCALTQSLTGGAAKANLAESLAAAAKKTDEIAAQKKQCAVLAKREVSWDEEIAMGGAVAMGMASKTKGVFIEPSAELKDVKLQPAEWKDRRPKPASGPKTTLHTYLNQLGKGLAASSPRPTIDWKFVVIDNDAVNAFSAPGGYVMLTSGLLKSVENEAQLAGVVAHEIAHVAHRHSLESYKSTKKLQCELALGTQLIGDVASEALPADVSNFKAMVGEFGFDMNAADATVIRKITDATVEEVMKRGYGPGMENDADRTAVEMLFFTGYDPREYSKYLAKLPEGGGFLTPHPSNKSRVQNVDGVIAELGGSDGFAAPRLGDKLQAVK
jgi:hypothetical protein